MAKPSAEDGPVVDGVLVCDKPAGPTSHDVVARVRRLAGQRRVGHAGTLDPPATGVLVVALGRATRLLPWLPLEPKGYLARIRFGTATDTLDATGTVTATAPVGDVDEAAVKAGLAAMVGPAMQVPPMVSAIKVGGERLYAKARRGEEIERKPRPVVLHGLELLGFEAGESGPEALVDVTCSGGTYVRSIADDLGRALGSAAHLADLRRTRVGAFTTRDAAALDALEAGGRDALLAAILTPAAAMAGVGTRTLDEAETADLAVGKPLTPTGTPGPIAAVAPDGRLVAVVEDERGRARPRVVLA
jgi:tRNA pseudouridine55 synthase